MRAQVFSFYLNMEVMSNVKPRDTICPERQESVNRIKERKTLSTTKEVAENHILQSRMVDDFRSSLQSQDKEKIIKLARSISEEFRKEITSSQKYLLYDAWMGYIPDKESIGMKFTNIRIVAFFNKGLQTPSISTFHEIAVYWRQMNKVSSEAKKTLAMEDRNVNVSHDIPGQQAKDLFCRHSNLTMIHVSSFKSTKFKTKEQMIYRGPCIALYCRIKGIIPVGEEPFPPKIGDLETDVREGYCTLAAGDELQPGAEIYCRSANKSGTVGGFVKGESGFKGFITAAHVMADCTQLVKDNAYKERLFESGTIKVKRGKSPHEKLGKVIGGCFMNDNPNETSVDVAVVQMDQLISMDGKFPETTENLLTNTGYTSGNLPNIRNTLLTHKEIQQNKRADVLKYGAKTTLTLGKLSLDEVHVCFDDGSLKLVDERRSDNTIEREEQFHFYKQMGVFSTARQFFELGDSGAFCFMVDKDDDMIVQPFGMAIGISSAGICIVTPLEDIFQKLRMKVSLCPSDEIIHAKHGESFPSSSNKVRESDDTKEMFHQILGHMADGFKKIESRIENVESEIKREIQNVKTEVEEMKSGSQNLQIEKRGSIFKGKKTSK